MKTTIILLTILVVYLIAVAMPDGRRAAYDSGQLSGVTTGWCHEIMRGEMLNGRCWAGLKDKELMREGH